MRKIKNGIFPTAVYVCCTPVVHTVSITANISPPPRPACMSKVKTADNTPTVHAAAVCMTRPTQNPPTVCIILGMILYDDKSFGALLWNVLGMFLECSTFVALRAQAGQGVLPGKV